MTTNKPEAKEEYIDEIRTGTMGTNGYITPCITAFTGYMKTFMGGELTKREKACSKTCPRGRTLVETMETYLKYLSIYHDGLIKTMFEL